MGFHMNNMGDTSVLWAVYVPETKRIVQIFEIQGQVVV